MTSLAHRFAVAWIALAGAVLAQEPSATSRPASPASPPAKDPIEGTKWLGTITSPTGPAQFGVEFRRSPRGTLVFIETFPVMHIYSQPTSRVTPRDGAYVLDDLPGSARIEGGKLRGIALFAKMPFELERVDSLPAAPGSSPATFPAGPAPLWSRALGAAAWAGPVAHDGVLYLGTADGHFHALRASDGHEVWTWAGATPIYGEALVTSDSVFFVDDRTELVRLDRKNGVPRFRVALDPTRRDAPKLPDDDTYSHRTAAPVLDGGVIYVGSTDGGVFALDASTGRTKWRVDAKSKICAPAALAGDRVVVGAFDGTLLALRRSDGLELWRRQLVQPIVSAPVVYGREVIVGSRDYLLHAYGLEDGGEIWSQHFWASWIESTPRVFEGTLYIGSSDLRAVRALDPSTGAVLWSTDVFGSAWASPLVTRSFVYMGVVGVKDYLIDHRPSIVALDRKTGAIRWRILEQPPAEAKESGHAGALALAGHVLYAAGLDGTLVALPAPEN